MESGGSARRLAAILSADAAGYSRLMAEDEEATVRTLQAHRDAMAGLVARHGGRVVDAPGDNLLAEFPSVVEALRCALEIQSDTSARDAPLPVGRRMPFRIGVHLGDVLVEDGRIYGDGVNVAARLEAMAEVGGICISDAVYQQVRRRLELGFEDLGECEVKNIPDPVRAYRVRSAGGRARPFARPRSRLRIALGAAGLALVLGAGALWLSWPAPVGLVLDLAGLSAPPVNPGLPEEPSIVVLPFDSLGDDPEQGYLAEGITEDMTAGLAGIPRIFVISRNTASTYAGGAVNLADVGRELGVRYVVEGSVRRVGGRVRVTAQLIDAERDVHVWSERYDREVGDLLDLQTEIVEQVLGALDVEIQDAEFERLRRRSTDSLSAYEAYARGMGHLRKLTRADLSRAEELFQRAIELDPEFAAAHGALAMTLASTSIVYCPPDREALDRVDAVAKRAIALDPFELNARLALLSAQFAGFMLGDDTAIEPREAARVVELAPNSDVAHFFLGGALVVAGRPLEAVGSFRRALRLSPRPLTTMLGMLGHANFLAGRRDVGAEWYERARAQNPDVIGARLGLIAYHGAAGRTEEARAVARELLRQNPECTLDDAMRVVPPAFREVWREQLRAAGFAG